MTEPTELQVNLYVAVRFGGASATDPVAIALRAVLRRIFLPSEPPSNARKRNSQRSRTRKEHAAADDKKTAPPPDAKIDFGYSAQRDALWILRGALADFTGMPTRWGEDTRTNMFDDDHPLTRNLSSFSEDGKRGLFARRNGTLSLLKLDHRDDKDFLDSLLSAGPIRFRGMPSICAERGIVWIILRTDEEEFGRRSAGGARRIAPRVALELMNGATASADQQGNAGVFDSSSARLDALLLTVIINLERLGLMPVPRELVEAIVDTFVTTGASAALMGKFGFNGAALRLLEEGRIERDELIWSRTQKEYYRSIQHVGSTTDMRREIVQWVVAHRSTLAPQDLAVLLGKSALETVRSIQELMTLSEIVLPTLPDDHPLREAYRTASVREQAFWHAERVIAGQEDMLPIIHRVWFFLAERKLEDMDPKALEAMEYLDGKEICDLGRRFHSSFLYHFERFASACLEIGSHRSLLIFTLALDRENRPHESRGTFLQRLVACSKVFSSHGPRDGPTG